MHPKHLEVVKENKSAQATSGDDHANGGWPCSLHEVQEQRAQKVPHRLQLLDGGDPHGHGSVLRRLLHTGVKNRRGVYMVH